MNRNKRYNRQYEEMLAAAVKRLAEADPRRIASVAGLELDEAAGVFTFQSLGMEVRLARDDYRALTSLDMWHHLVILQYLAQGNGDTPDRTWISLGELPGGGTTRGPSFDREIDALIAGRLSGMPPERIEGACRALGGEPPVLPHSDLSSEFLFMPRYPLRMNLWFSDKEFPASGRVLVNGGVRRALGVEAAGTAALLLMNRLCRACGPAPSRQPSRP